MRRSSAKLPHDILELLDISWAPGDGGLAVFLTQLLAYCERWFDASGASIFLQTADPGLFLLAAAAGSESSIPAHAMIREGVGIAGTSIQSGEALLINDPKDHPLLAKHRLTQKKAIQSALVIPLTSGGANCVGVLNLSRSAGRVPFDQADLKFAKTLARYVALAVGNARLLTEIRAAHGEVERAAVEHARLSRLAEIGQMTAAIAHEIRNPLTGILSAAQMIAISPEDATTFSRVIEQEAVKLNSLCDQFLEFAKPVSVRRKPVSLVELARRLAAVHYRQFAAAKVKLHIDNQGGEPTIDVDELQIEQVMRNLMLNALQATMPGGYVRLTVRPGGFAVEDSGCGMSPEILERLFTPFFTTKPSGTGLGLSTVRKIVEAHGGALRVDSKPGSGTTFEVVLGAETSNVRLSA